MWGLKQSTISNSFDSVKFQTHIYRNKWHRMVREINKKPEVLEQIREMVVRARGVDNGEDSDDSSLFAGCPTDSEAEA